MSPGVLSSFILVDIEYNVPDGFGLVWFGLVWLFFGLSYFGLEVLWFDWGKSRFLGMLVKARSEKTNKKSLHV